MSIPTVGRIVHFRSRTGNYTVPAIVTAIPSSLYPPGVEAGHVPEITTATGVHLTVFTPGIQGEGMPSRAAAEDFVAPLPEGRSVSENQGGTYQEWDVPFWDPQFSPNRNNVDGIYTDQHAGTWTWPPRV